MASDFCDSLLHIYSDADLVRYIKESPRIEPISSVFQLSPTLLAKSYEASAVEDVLQVTDLAHQLGIRVPCIERSVVCNGSAYCIMQRIQGSTLEEAWKQLSWFKTFKLALQLRRYIRLLRSITSTTAGSIATGACRSFWLDDRFGLPARSTPQDVASFIQFWIDFTSIRKEVAGHSSTQPMIPGLLFEKAFVLIHHDLAPRNMIVDRFGQLWLLDWDYAGFYPKCFEYAAMQNFSIPQDWNYLAKLRWNLFSWVTAGLFKQAAEALERIRFKFTRFAAGRRFELLRKGGPSRRPVS